MKQGNHYIESNVSQSTLNIPSISLTSVSQSPLTKEKILEIYGNALQVQTEGKTMCLQDIHPGKF